MPQLLYPQERPRTHCVGVWVGARVCLDGCGKISPPLGFDPQTIQRVASRNSDCAIPTPRRTGLYSFCFISSPPPTKGSGESQTLVVATRISSGHNFNLVGVKPIAQPPPPPEVGMRLWWMGWPTHAQNLLVESKFQMSSAETNHVISHQPFMFCLQL